MNSKSSYWNSIIDVIGKVWYHSANYSIGTSWTFHNNKSFFGKLLPSGISTMNYKNTHDILSESQTKHIM
jgi:hypothetical protein